MPSYTKAFQIGSLRVFPAQPACQRQFADAWQDYNRSWYKAPPRGGAPRRKTGSRHWLTPAQELVLVRALSQQETGVACKTEREWTARLPKQLGPPGPP